ncbi:MAG: helix-turn-helix domain-containing protein [Clostridiales bacterium]|jgi:transcriptional regulator with XRE-family HTH domain|nr:helix-turn-helix domain-containing protein [Clostridiales bacterium]
MTIERAVARRILEICLDKHLSVSALAHASNVNPSTIYEFLAGRTKCPTVTVIKMLCDGVKMPISDFFEKEYFYDNAE